MKKTISLILGMFLILLTGCGKSSKLIRPTDSAETQETTWSESKPQSDESTEKKEETIEQKPATNSWITKELIAIAIGTAIGAYALYKFMDWVINTDYKIPGGEDDDEYSDSVPMQCANRGEGLNYVVCNGVLSQVAANNGMTYWGYEDVRPSPGKPIRVVSARGDHVISENKVDAYMQKFENGELGPKPLTN